jgi:hypothetical protein
MWLWFYKNSLLSLRKYRVNPRIWDWLYLFSYSGSRKIKAKRTAFVRATCENPSYKNQQTHQANDTWLTLGLYYD